MEFKRLIKTIYTTITAITALSVVLLTLSFTTAFDATNGYFEGGALPLIFNIFFILGIILSFVCVFLLRKQQVIKTDNQIENQKIAYAIFIVLLGVSSVGFNIFTITKYSSSAILGMCFFTLFVVVCFLKGGYKYSHSKLLLLLASILFPVFVTLENNLVMNRHSNSVENMLTSIFSIAFLIYILYEGKRVFSGEHSPWHFASMMLLAHTGLTLSVSYCIAYLLGSVNETSRLYQIVLIFAMSSFVEFELIRFVRNAKSHTKEE